MNGLAFRRDAFRGFGRRTGPERPPATVRTPPRPLPNDIDRLGNYPLRVGAEHWTGRHDPSHRNLPGLRILLCLPSDHNQRCVCRQPSSRRCCDTAVTDDGYCESCARWCP